MRYTVAAVVFLVAITGRIRSALADEPFQEKLQLPIADADSTNALSSRREFLLPYHIEEGPQEVS
jgi:hypothetical protein